MHKKLKTNVIIFSSALTGMYMVNKHLFKNTPVLESPMEGEENNFFSQYGNLYFIKKGTGEPLLLLHGITPGASCHEWRKNFDELSKHFTVYALDLPGFGKSQKLSITYKASVFRSIVRSFIREEIGEPVNIIASLHSAAYAIKLEKECPGIIKSIIAVCPTGIFSYAESPSLRSRFTHSVIKSPLIGTFIYNLMVSRPRRSYFLRRNSCFNNKILPPELIRHYGISSRQDGYLSKFAPASLMGGYLNQDIADALHGLNAPLLVLWGRHSQLNPVSNLSSFLDIKPDIKYQVFEDSGVYPHEECPEKFNKICIDFLNNGKFIH